MKKIYRDEVSGLVVEDLSGVKPIETINAEFKSQFVDITPPPLTKEQEEAIKKEKENQPENMIRREEKNILRAMSIDKLKKEGKLPDDYE